MANAPPAPTTARPAPAPPRVLRAPRWLARALRWLAPIAALVAIVALVLRYQRAHLAPPVKYESARVDRGAIAARVTATGSVSALVTVSVGSQVSGRIESLKADFGSTVKRGQIVATIEPSLFRAAVAQARANHDVAMAAVGKARAQQRQAGRDFARAKGLLAQSLLSQADYDAAEANVGVADAGVASASAGLEQAEAALGQAELNLSYCTIRSPIDGVVISRNVDVGQTVAATLAAPTLFTIAQDLTKMQVDTNVAEADVGKIRAGMDVTFTVDAYPAKTFRGVVRQVRDNAQTIQNVVTYDAVIDVDNGERLLKPSMTANVTAIHATRDGALRLPNAALRFKPDPATIALMTGAPKGTHAAPLAAAKPDERVVWILRGGRPQSAKVRIGISDGETTEVLGGDVREGDDVVTEANVDPSAKGKP